MTYEGKHGGFHIYSTDTLKDDEVLLIGDIPEITGVIGEKETIKALKKRLPAVLIKNLKSD